MPSRRLKFLKAPSFFIFLCFLATASEALAIQDQSAVVREALTGDTVRLAGGQLLKYAGLRAEKDSLEFNKSLVDGQKIRLEWDSKIRDNHNNLLAYVFLENGTFVNLELIKAGLARATNSAPNRRYVALFRKAELEARRQKNGVWKHSADNPYLKNAYIGDKNTKIYYFPTSQELAGVPESYRVTFGSRVEAKAAGYKACFGCRENSAESEAED